MRTPLSGLASKDLFVRDLVLPTVFAHARHVVVLPATSEKFFSLFRVDRAIESIAALHLLHLSERAASVLPDIRCPLI